MKKTVYFLLAIIIALSCSFLGCKKESGFVDANTEFTIKVGTYNIERGNEVDWDFSVIAEDIKKFNLDLVGFQEVDEGTKALDRRSVVKELSDATGLEYYHFTNVTPQRPGYIGNCFISRYPIVSVEDFMFDTTGNKYKRAYCNAILDVNGNLVHFYNTHLTHNDDQMVVAQQQLLKDLSMSNSRFIITADFNDLLFHYCDIFNTETLVNTRQTPYLTAGDKKDDGSFEGKKPLDNIIASGNAELINAGCYNEVYHSDHCLLYCTLKFHKL